MLVVAMSVIYRHALMRDVRCHADACCQLTITRYFLSPYFAAMLMPDADGVFV